jgi:hypothetical protein
MSPFFCTHEIIVRSEICFLHALSLYFVVEFLLIILYQNTMIDQNKNLDEKSSGGWAEKKEAMQRLATALENTTPPLMNKNAGNTPPATPPTTSKWLQKLKSILFSKHIS